MGPEAADMMEIAPAEGVRWRRSGLESSIGALFTWIVWFDGDVTVIDGEGRFDIVKEGEWWGQHESNYFIL